MTGAEENPSKPKQKSCFKTWRKLFIHCSSSKLSFQRRMKCVDKDNKFFKYFFLHSLLCVFKLQIYSMCFIHISMKLDTTMLSSLNSNSKAVLWWSWLRYFSSSTCQWFWIDQTLSRNIRFKTTLIYYSCCDIANVSNFSIFTTFSYCTI